MELKIYLANMSKYNKGILLGKWVDVLDSPDWPEELANIGVVDSEFFIADYETDIDGLKIPEGMSLDELDDIAGAINYTEY